MIVSCTSCEANYNINERNVQGGRVLLRCPACKTWFSVAISVPVEPAPAPPSEAEQPKITEPVTEETASETIKSTAFRPIKPAVEETAAAETATAVEPAENVPEEPPIPLKVLIADAPTPFRHRILETLHRVDPNLETVLADDGRLAIDELETFTPDAAIIGTGIEVVYCFEICDYMRSKENLKDARIIFASELHPAAWHCGEPESLHGADAWLSNAANDDELYSALNNQLQEVRASHQQPAPVSVAEGNEAE